MTFAESSPKSGYAIFFVNIMKCQQNCICWGCRCVMGLWKVLLHQWWLWGPAAAIRWRNHRRFVAADHWRRAEGGRGGLIMPNQGLIPTICLLSTVYTFTLRLLTVYSKVHCTVVREGVNLSLQRSVMSEITRNPEEELQHRATNVSWSSFDLRANAKGQNITIWNVPERMKYPLTPPQPENRKYKVLDAIEYHWKSVVVSA